MGMGEFWGKCYGGILGEVLVILEQDEDCRLGEAESLLLAYCKVV